MAVLVRRIDPRWILPVATDSNEQLSIDHVTKRAWQVECKRLVKCSSIERSVPMQSGGQVGCNFATAMLLRIGRSCDEAARSPNRVAVSC